eukprot:5238325-Pleurochrysis_carterae.AAC.1
MHAHVESALTPRQYIPILSTPPPAPDVHSQPWRFGGRAVGSANCSSTTTCCTHSTTTYCTHSTATTSAKSLANAAHTLSSRPFAHTSTWRAALGSSETLPSRSSMLPTLGETLMRGANLNELAPSFTSSHASLPDLHSVDCLHSPNSPQSTTAPLPAAQHVPQLRGVGDASFDANLACPRELPTLPMLQQTSAHLASEQTRGNEQ